MGCFDGHIKVYSPTDLSQDFLNDVDETITQSRGGGYWIWKPYIIYKMLNSLNENDILLYADGGCRLQKSGLSRLLEYKSMISPESGKSVLAMRVYEPEKKWTYEEIFDYLQVPKDSAIRETNQIAATCGVFRKCKESLSLIKRWLDTARHRPDLFTDVYNESNKKINTYFMENRHDQSIFSVLVKLDPENTCIVIQEETEKFNDMSKPIHAMRRWKKYAV